MKSFWISLLVFVLLMCSCRSKKVVSEIQSDTKRVSEISYLNETVKIDTSKTAYFANETQRIVIEEDITVIEYDKESGKPVKETNAKRKTTQDFEKASSEEVQNRVEIHLRDSLNHVADVSKKVESESETVTECNGLVSVWDKVGNALGIATIVIVAYLCWKLKQRIN